jgi:hypothetical protein
LEPPNGVNESKAGPHRLLGVVLVRLRVAEVHQHPIAHVIGDEAVEAGDRIGDAAVIGADDLAQVLGVQARRQRRRADQITEHHGELPAFGTCGSRAGAVAPRQGATAECRSRLSL